MTDAYPLTWPSGWPRTHFLRRERARFSQKSWKTGYHEQITFQKATSDLFEELTRLGAKKVILSSNLQTRADGIPYANQKRPDDPGIAVYFTLDGVENCIPCDKWDRAEDNIKAIAKTIDALRGIERWGAKEMVNAAFRGFKALPSPSTESQSTPRYFEDCLDQDHLKSRYKRLAKELHPDTGGDASEFAEMQRQFNLAKEAFQ